MDRMRPERPGQRSGNAIIQWKRVEGVKSGCMHIANAITMSTLYEGQSHYYPVLQKVYGYHICALHMALRRYRINSLGKNMRTRILEECQWRPRGESKDCGCLCWATPQPPCLAGESIVRSGVGCYRAQGTALGRWSRTVRVK